MGELSIREQIVFLNCGELDRTASFYEDRLGFELVVDQGTCRIVRIADGGGYLGYCQRSGGEVTAAGVIITLVVGEPAEVDAWYQYLLDRGLEVGVPPKHNPAYGIYHFFCEDPDGYLVEIQAFLDPAWESPPR